MRVNPGLQFEVFVFACKFTNLNFSHSYLNASMDWSDVRIFLAVARSGSLSGAAQRLGMSQPTMGRRLRALEDSTGQRLFQRGREGFQLTDEGASVLCARRADGRRGAHHRATTCRTGRRAPRSSPGVVFRLVRTPCAFARSCAVRCASPWGARRPHHGLALSRPCPTGGGAGVSHPAFGKPGHRPTAVHAHDLCPVRSGRDASADGRRWRGQPAHHVGCGVRGPPGCALAAKHVSGSDLRAG